MRIKPLVVLSLVCSLSQAADTVAYLGDSIKATQFVTAVDHTRLVNGTTEVIANADGTASISTAQIVQKPNCVRVSQADGSTGKTIVLSFRQTSDELESWWSSWPDQLEFTIEYDGVSYDATTVGESDLDDCREVSTSLSWANGSRICPAGVSSPTYWDGVLHDFESPGGLDIVGDGNGESCSTYTYTSSTGTSALIATVPFVDGHKWDWSTQITNKPTNVSAFNNDAGYVTANHTHSNLVNGTTEVVANNDRTASIVSTTEVYGFKVSARTRDQSRSEGYQPILIEMEIPIPLTTFDDAMFRTVQSIRLRICEPLTGGNPREIVPWQTVALDHTKFGGPESQYFGIADNAITQVNSEWFTDINPGYNWINDIYNSPFRINYANATVSSLYTAWGPLGSTTEDTLTADLVGKKRQIATVDQIQPIATTIARQIIRDAVSNVSTNIQSAEDARVSLTNLITILKNL